MQIRVLTGEEVRLALPMAETVETMKAAFGQLSTGKAIMPLRSRINVTDRDGVALFMPALLTQSGDLALKVVSNFPHNLDRGLPAIHGLVMALDPESGQPIALLEGGTLTAIRTGAGSGAATDLLARREASTAAIFGSGVQARTQLEAICAVREIEKVWIYSPNRSHVEAFVAELKLADWIGAEIELASTPGEAIDQAEIICTATDSHSPVFDGEDLSPGTHINAVGSFTPKMQELDPSTVVRSLVVVDSREAALAEAGELIIAIRDGHISEDHIHAELGEIVAGKARGRTSAEQVTLFKSVGIAVQDAAAAGLALRRAEDLGLGQIVEL